MQCTFHPNTETLLQCSKCEKPICSRCAIQTPVGARCPECANVQRIPTYNLPRTQLTKAIVVALVVGLALGVFFGLLQPVIPDHMLWILRPVAFIASGFLVGEAISRVTNRKRVPTLQWLAIAGYVLAFVVYFTIAPVSVSSGIYTLAGLMVGGALALNPFR